MPTADMPTPDVPTGATDDRPGRAARTQPCRQRRPSLDGRQARPAGATLHALDRAQLDLHAAAALDGDDLAQRAGPGVPDPTPVDPQPGPLGQLPRGDPPRAALDLA